MRVLVTGSTGFVGKRLVEILLNQGYDVAVFNRNKKYTPEKTLSLSNIEVFLGDITKKNDVKSALESVDAVVHLAGIRSDDEKESYKVNVEGFKNLLESLKECNFKGKLVFSSSASVYGDEVTKIKETTLVNPMSIYGKHKVLMEELAENYQKYFDITGLRIFNVYGNDSSKDSSHRGILSILEEKIAEGKALNIYSNSVRDFIHVNDVVKVIIKALNSKSPHILNVATGVATSLDQLVDYIKKFSNKEIVIKTKNSDVGVNFSCADISLLNSFIDTSKFIKLKDGVKESFSKKLLPEVEKGKSWLTIGIVPPPLGGVSVYHKRLIDRLKEDGNSVYNIDPSKFSKLQKFLSLFKIVFNKQDVIYSNSFSFFFLTAVVIKSFISRSKIIHHIHSPNSVLNITGWKRAFVKFYLNKVVDTLRLDGMHVFNQIVKEDLMPENMLDKVSVVRPFIAPLECDRKQVEATWPKELLEFINKQNPIVVINAFKIVHHKDFGGVDLYGLDMLSEVSVNIKEKYPNIGFIFSIANDDNKDYINELKSIWQKNGVEENVFLLTGQLELWPIFKYADILVRPTVTDGDAVSIREALHFGADVIASDVVPRPAGVISFKTRDLEDFNNKILATLNKRKKNG